MITQNVILIGPPNSGKSLLSEKLQNAFDNAFSITATQKAATEDDFIQIMAEYASKQRDLVIWDGYPKNLEQMTAMASIPNIKVIFFDATDAQVLAREHIEPAELVSQRLADFRTNTMPVAQRLKEIFDNQFLVVRPEINSNQKELEALIKKIKSGF